MVKDWNFNCGGRGASPNQEVWIDCPYCNRTFDARGLPRYKKYCKQKEGDNV